MPLGFRVVAALSVLHVVSRDDDEVVFDKLEEIGMGPDKLPGLDAILSAVATRVAEVHP